MLQFAQMGFPEMYETALVEPLFRPWAEDLVAETGVSSNDRVLDVACGTGIVARLARRRVGDGGKVVGVDVNSAMLAVASTIAPDIEWRTGSADALPVPAGEVFDIVTCQQGIQFFPDRLQSVLEMRRVLAPGGRVALSAWRSDDEAPFLRELRRIAERTVGPIDDRRHSFDELSVLESVLREAGFNRVEVRPVTKTIQFGDGQVFIFLNAMALVGMSRHGRDLAEQERQHAVSRIVGDSRELLQSHSTEAGLAYEIAANVAMAAM